MSLLENSPKTNKSIRDKRPEKPGKSATATLLGYKTGQNSDHMKTIENVTDYGIKNSIRVQPIVIRTY